MFGLSATRPIRPVSVPELRNGISQRSKVRLYEVKTSVDYSCECFGFKRSSGRVSNSR